MTSKKSLSDRIYNYPKSSCNCYKCTDKKYTFSEGPPSNLSVRNCDVSDYFGCYDRQFIDEKMQPRNKAGIEFINPQAIDDKYSPHFGKVVCDKKHPCNNCDGCKEPQFASWDPRTWSASHNQYLTFDRPPIESTVKLEDVYSEKLRGYGKGYDTYSDINAGQIMYYVDKSREDAYYPPNFTIPVNVTRVVYQDPMGALKPEYQRQVPYTNPITQQSCNYDPYCLSFIKDTQQHRDDMLTGISVKMNQQRWEPRWAPN